MKQSTKDWIQYSTAIAMVASAIVIAFLAFIITSTIESGVLIYIAQALCYAGGIFGVSIYFKNKMGEFESNAKEKIQEIVNDMVNKNS
ncbi:MAG: hypothetical protein IIW66_03350 [Bacteroidales bacterium]|jgi:hypothetical protein|nr:hypothetical protein [Bacteroidales bacterium]